MPWSKSVKYLFVHERLCYVQSIFPQRKENKEMKSKSMFISFARMVQLESMFVGLMLEYLLYYKDSGFSSHFLTQ